MIVYETLYSISFSEALVIIDQNDERRKALPETEDNVSLTSLAIFTCYTCYAITTPNVKYHKFEGQMRQ